MVLGEAVSQNKRLFLKQIRHHASQRLYPGYKTEKARLAINTVVNNFFQLDLHFYHSYLDKCYEIILVTFWDIGLQYKMKLVVIYHHSHLIMSCGPCPVKY